MGQGFTFAGAMGNFTVTKSNPSGLIVRFTVADPSFLLTTTKMIRAVIADAIDQFILAERADLNTNGDSQVKGSNDYDPRHVGDGFINVNWKFGSKYAELTLSSLSSIAATGTITVAIPYADVD